MFLKKKNIRRHSAEKMCGLSNGHLYKTVGENGDLGFKSIEKILRTFPELNRGWLISGEGTMLRQPAADTAGDLTQTDSITAEAPETYTTALTPDDIAALRIEVRLLREQNDKLIAALANRP